jgi:hypothetical protein
MGLGKNQVIKVVAAGGSSPAIVAACSIAPAGITPPAVVQVCKLHRTCLQHWKVENKPACVAATHTLILPLLLPRLLTLMAQLPLLLLLLP